MSPLGLGRARDVLPIDQPQIRVGPLRMPRSFPLELAEGKKTPQLKGSNHAQSELAQLATDIPDHSDVRTRLPRVAVREKFLAFA